MLTPRLQAGDRIADHELIEPLGEGGMGVVWRALAPTGAEVALKLVPALEEDELLQRFEREAQALARVDRHPNVLRVHAAGRDGPFLFMSCELAQGGSLADRLREGPLAIDEARTLVEAIAQGLSHVHAAQLLHRDVKPANVLFDADGVPLLADFGLARFADRHSLTESGSVMGTPSYMAPEQARGEPLDARCDVYSLGAVLFAALTGQPPHAASSALGLLDKVCREDAPSPRVLRPEVPPALAAVCRRALRRDREERYESADALSAALTRPDVDGGKRPTWGAVLALTVLLLVAAISWRATSPPAPPPLAEATQAPPPSLPGKERIQSRVAQARALFAQGGPLRTRVIVTLDPEGPVDGALWLSESSILTWGKELLVWDLDSPAATLSRREGRALPTAPPKILRIAASGTMLAAARVDHPQGWLWPDGELAKLPLPWLTRDVTFTAAGDKVVFLGQGGAQAFTPTGARTTLPGLTELQGREFFRGCPSTDDRYFAVAVNPPTRDGSYAIEVYDLEAGGLLAYRDNAFPGLMKGLAATGVRSFAFSSQARLFHLTLREGGQTADRIEFVAPGPLNMLRVAHPNQGIVSLAASRARDRLLSIATSDDRKRFTLRAWELSSGKPLRLSPESRWKPNQVAFDPLGILCLVTLLGEGQMRAHRVEVRLGEF